MDNDGFSAETLKEVLDVYWLSSSNMFLKRPERLIALLMVFGLVLLIYSLAER